MSRNLIVSSAEFSQDELIPVEYTADGEGANPPLTIDDIPQKTQFMALIMEDPDAPKGTFTHWVLWDMPAANSIGENTNPGVSGLNSLGKMGYTPPNPPATTGQHRYYFHIYALDNGLDLAPGSDRAALEKAMKGHIMASGTLMARYGRVPEHADH